MAKPALGRGLSALLGGKPSVAPEPSPGPVSPSPAPMKSPEAGASVSVTVDVAGASAAVASPSAPPVGGSAVAANRGGDVSPGQGVARVGVARIRPSALQPRRDFPAESLRELSDSIRAQGILQPLVVRKSGEFLELIAGERRWRAAQMAGLSEVPVILRDADDTTVLELMLVENLQREGLNPMDEAQGYSELIERFRLTQEAVATKVGRSRAAVANALRLLKLPTPVQVHVREGRVTTGHAKVLLGLSNAEQQESVADRITKDSLSVRQTEEWVSRLSATAHESKERSESSPRAPATLVRDPHVAAIEDRLRQRLGTKVSLRYRQGRGQLDIRFFSDAELERVLEILGIRMD